jgi:hypothetical protein
MRQVMPHRSNIVADPDNCKSFLHKNAWNHSFGLTGDRLFQLDRNRQRRVKLARPVCRLRRRARLDESKPC